MSNQIPRVVVACRIRKDFVEKLDAIAARRGQFRAEVMERALEREIREEFNGQDRGSLREGTA